MLQKIKLVGSVIVLAGAGIFVLVNDARSVAAATERYQLTAAGEDFAKSCRSALSSNDQEFSSGQSPANGCACIAAEVAKTYGDDLAAPTVVMTAVVEMADKPQDHEPDWEALSTRANVDEATLFEQLGVNMAAMTACNQSS